MNTKSRKLYLAYGSNLDKFQMSHRCPGAKAVGTGVIKDYRLMFKGSKTGSYLTIEPAKGYKVPVGVWSVTPEDERMLDIYEGYPRFYYKADMRLPVTNFGSKETKMRKAFVYIMHEDHKLGKPSQTYMKTCAFGYRDFGFDLKILKIAYDYSIGEVDS